MSVWYSNFVIQDVWYIKGLVGTQSPPLNRFYGHSQPLEGRCGVVVRYNPPDPDFTHGLVLLLQVPDVFSWEGSLPLCYNKLRKPLYFEPASLVSHQIL